MDFFIFALLIAICFGYCLYVCLYSLNIAVSFLQLSNTLDSITQFVLGAALGEAVAGKKIGNKAIFWGGIAGTIPDLDVVLSPFLDEVQRLTVHRSISHALLFGFVVAPLLGWLLHRYYKNEKATFRDWTWLMFLGIFTHPLLDACTAYGTQLFLPFSDYRVGLNNVFIIDFFYTLPLLIAMIICLCLPRESRKRWLINMAALTISTAYLGLSLVNKQVVGKQFERAFAEQHIPYKRYLTGVSPLNIWLWYGVAETDSGYYVGYRSLFDKTDKIDLVYMPRHEEWIADIKNEYAIDRLIWFSKGYYVIRQREGKLLFFDLKFGLGTMELKDANVPFYFEIYKDENGKICWREQQEMGNINISVELANLWQRIKGI